MVKSPSLPDNFISILAHTTIVIISPILNDSETFYLTTYLWEYKSHYVKIPNRKYINLMLYYVAIDITAFSNSNKQSG